MTLIKNEKFVVKSGDVILDEIDTSNSYVVIKSSETKKRPLYVEAFDKPEDNKGLMRFNKKVKMNDKYYTNIEMEKITY